MKKFRPKTSFSYSKFVLTAVLMTAFAFVSKAQMTHVASTTDGITYISNPYLSAGENGQLIGRVIVQTGGTVTPALNVSTLNLNTTGTTNPADITAARVYYTITPKFNTTNLFGTVNSPSGAFAVNGSQDLVLSKAAGLADTTNYFWVVYDISANPAFCGSNYAGLACESITVGGTAQIPTVSTVIPNRLIGHYRPGRNAYAPGLLHGANTSAMTSGNSYFGQQNYWTSAVSISNGSDTYFDYSGGAIQGAYSTFSILGTMGVGVFNGQNFQNLTPTDYPGTATPITPGSPYTWTVTRGGTHGDNKPVRVWVDWNDDGDFSDPDEFIYESTTGGLTATSASFTVPSSATAGCRTMRVVTGYDMTSIGATPDANYGGIAGINQDSITFQGTYTVFGLPVAGMITVSKNNTNAATINGSALTPETPHPAPSADWRDFKITVGEAVNCTGATVTTNPANVSLPLCSGTASTSFTVAATGTGPLTYQWQVSTNGGTAWANVTNNTIYSGANTSTLNLTNVPIGMSGYQYQVLVSNACSNIQSTAATLTLAGGPTANAGSHQNICGLNPATINATGSSPVGYTWTHNGAGSLSSTSTLATIYTPATGDLGNTITLTLTAQTNNACPAATSTVTVTFNQSQQYFQDTDGDGHGNPSMVIITCTQPAGYVTNNTDCNDTNPNVWQGTPVNVTINWTGSQTVCINGTPTTLSGGSPAGGTWSGTGVTGTTFNQTTLAAGQYTITYTVAGDGQCQLDGSATVTLTAQNCTDINENELPQLVVYPSYTQDKVTLTGVMMQEAIIIDSNGRVLGTHTINSNMTELSLADYAAGIYFIRVKTTAGMQVVRVMKV